MSAARAKARDDFDASRNLQPNSEDAQKQVAHANEVAKILKENVVQGQANDDGRYSTSGHFSIEFMWLTGCIAVELRIHEHTERGDNETIKQTKGNNSLAGVKCCSS